MISKEEWSNLQQKLVVLSEKKDSILKEIEQAKADNEELNEIIPKLETMKNENEDLEQQQMKELAQATNDLHSFRANPDKTPQIFKKGQQKRIKKLENSLKSQEEKLTKLDEQIEQLKNENSQNDTQANEIDDEIEKMEAHVTKLEKLAVRIPPGAPIRLQLEDLQERSRLLTFQNQFSKKRIPELEQDIASVKGDNSLKIAELGRITSQAQSNAQALLDGQKKIQESFTTLDSLSHELELINQEMRAETTHCQQKLDSIHSTIETQSKELHDLKQRMQQCDETEKTFIADKQTIEDDNAIKISKSKKKAEQLMKMISELKAELLQKRNQSPIVQDLTKALETEWVEHQKTLDHFNKTEDTLKRKKEDLQRKKWAIEEVQSKKAVRSVTGIQNLEALYESALTENKLMAKQMVSMQIDFDTIQLENATLRSSLEAVQTL